MQNPVTAIRAGLPRPRFATPQQRHRERQLGLGNRSRIAAAATRRPSMLHPRAAIRAAARSLVRPTVRGPHGVSALHGASAIAWTRRTAVGLGPAREGSPAAWRA